MTFAQYKSREDILAHIKELEDTRITWWNIDTSGKRIKERARFIQKLKKMAEDFPR